VDWRRGFWYHIGELETAVRWGINTVILVINNSALNQSLTYLYSTLYGQTPAELVESSQNHGPRATCGGSPTSTSPQ